MTNLDFNDFFEQLKNQHQSSSEQMSRPGEIMTARYIRPDYQAAYSQLARKFTILERILNPSVLIDAEANLIIVEAIELIKAVEKAELTGQNNLGWENAKTQDEVYIELKSAEGMREAYKQALKLRENKQ